MGKVNTLLNERLKKTENTSKMSAMAYQSAHGQLTSFSGVFSVSDLSELEKETLSSILNNYAIDVTQIHQDLSSLIALTSEVKAINNQAALLHGERIKKVHTLLTRYRDGAFTAWLIAAYGNRQTPYNLMQYYEFCEAMPKPLRPLIESMPRQAVYTLATREGPLEKKRSIVEGYSGQTKAELLAVIRDTFPLSLQDKRRTSYGQSLLNSLNRFYLELAKTSPHLSLEQKKKLRFLLNEIQALVDKSDE